MPSFPVFTPVTLVAFFAAAWALILEYVPGVQDWFDSLTDPHQKQAIVAIGLFVIAAGATALSCAGVISGGVDCPNWWAGIVNAVELFVLALIINQPTHAITKKNKKA